MNCRYTHGLSPTDHAYTGQKREAALGLYFYNARFYSPTLGRFLAPDTLVPVQSQGVQAWDRYAYVNNNPLRFVDPTGHCVVGGHEMPDRSPACQDGNNGSSSQDAPDNLNVTELTTSSTNCDSNYCASAMDLYSLYKQMWYNQSGFWWEQYGRDGNFTVWEFMALLWAREMGHFADYYFSDGGFVAYMEAIVRHAHEYCSGHSCDISTAEGALNFLAAYSQSARSYAKRGSMSPSDKLDLPLGPSLTLVKAIRDPVAVGHPEWAQGRVNDEPYDVGNVNNSWQLTTDIAKLMIDRGWFVYHSPWQGEGTAFVLTACQSAWLSGDGTYSAWGCTMP